MRLFLASLVLLVLAPVALAEQSGTAVHMRDPRGFGFFVGDLLQRTAEIEVQDGEEFVPAALPQPGQLAYWLELRDVKPGTSHHAGQRRLVLDLTYQLFYVPVDTRKVKIPAINIELRGPAGTRVATIPPFTFLISPIREIYPEKSGETTETFLKDDAAPVRHPTAVARTSALVSAGVALLGLLLFARHSAWWPFHHRPARPFTAAQRVVHDHRVAYGGALLALHRAFDQSRGARLLAGDVDAFLAQRAEQGGASAAIQRFFRASQAYFYSNDRVAAEAAFPRSELERLATELAGNERAER